MKHLTVFLLSVLFSFSVKFIVAQTNITNDYIIISTATIEDTAPYIVALDAVNWEPYRIQNQRYELAFDNGFTIQLKSAIELVNLGYPLNLNNYRTENPIGYVPPTLKLLPGSIIGMEIHNQVITKHY